MKKGNFSAAIPAILWILGPLGASAQANQALVICGAHDPSGTTELDELAGEEGGARSDELIIRNSNILRYFVSAGAILASEIDANGAFTLDMLDFGGFAGPLSDAATVGEPPTSRGFSFNSDGQGGYLLVVNKIAADGFTYAGELANFHFTSDCQQLF